MKNLFPFFLLCVCALCLCAVGALAQPPQPVPLDTALDWQPERFGKCVMALERDLQGNLWVGTEDHGVWRFHAQRKAWQQWTTKDGLDDDFVYAIACDKRGRIWAGHLNHGVSVWNGTAWKNFNLLNGPLGERIFDIAVCPTDGDVWMATSAGLARYHADREWLYYHRGTGMPVDQVSALAFDAAGTLFAGTHCNGLAIATPADNYAQWRRVVSPYAKLPPGPLGRVLPSNVINDVLVMQNGTICVATDTGLARSEDGGQNWVFIRGANWQMRRDGAYANPRSKPEAASGKPFLFSGPILIEDAINCLAEDDRGRLWLGFNNKGIQCRDALTNQLLYDASQFGARDPNGDCVRAILPQSTAPNNTQPVAIYGRYGGVIGGLGRAGKVVAPSPVANNRIETENVPYPAPASPPTTNELQTLAQRVAVRTPAEAGSAWYLGADWRTQGDWVGRYGLLTATLCGMNSPRDQVLNPQPGYAVGAGIGPHFVEYDGRYSYIHWPQSNDLRVLFLPTAGVRRQAEWNDGSFNGARYPTSFEGPDLWVNVTIPAGTHRVALYFFNKDAHERLNRFRDFVIQVKNSDSPDRDSIDIAPPLAQARVRDFWGGVYHSFALQGPGKFIFKIKRNGSYVTQMQGVFIDRLDQAPIYEAFAPPTPEGEVPLPQALALWQAAQNAALAPEASPWQHMARLLAYRAVATEGKSPDTLVNWRRMLPLWTRSDREDFEDYMTLVAQALPKQ